MAKRIDESNNKYKIERVREPMSREELSRLYNEFKSDDDYLSYHLDTIKDTSYKYKVVIMNDENVKPVECFKNKNKQTSGIIDKLDDEIYSYSCSYADKDDAIDFIEDCINENRVSSKPRAVMQDGLNRKSIEKYNELVERERLECESVVNFTKPTFDEIKNNIYVNVYNGSTYNIKESDLPDDLREDVGVIIPGMIETRDEYFEFVKRLKDRGRNGLGRSIYERYEDYEEATDLIERYKQALYDKYGGKDEFLNAKAMGGMFGAYEYYPTIKPRFKKTARNIKLDKGINVNELALIKDMGARIREELDDEIESIEVSHDYIIYENTPPKFKDLPEDLQMFYKTDKYDMNGFDVLKHTHMSMTDYANKLIKEGNADEGYKILESIENEAKLMNDDYESNMISIVNEEDLTLDSLIGQCQYDKMLSLYHEDVDNHVDCESTKEGFAKFIKYQLAEEYEHDIDDIKGIDNDNDIKAIVEHATRYAFDKRYREDQDEKALVNSTNISMNQMGFGNSVDRNVRMNVKKGEDKITAFVRSIINEANNRIENMQSDADNVNKSAVNRRDIAGTNYSSQLMDNDINLVDINATPEGILEHIVNNEKFMKSIYELSSGKENIDELFSERVHLDEFVQNILKDNKPIFTENIIDKSLKNK
jgi:hypothetical protein